MTECAGCGIDIYDGSPDIISALGLNFCQMDCLVQQLRYDCRRTITSPWVPKGVNVMVPFSPEMAAASLAGSKCCTSRNKTYGVPGDWFVIPPFGRHAEIFELVAVLQMPLGYVRDRLFQEEGFNSPQEFEALWIELHPRKGFDPDHVVSTHWYRDVGRKAEALS